MLRETGYNTIPAYPEANLLFRLTVLTLFRIGSVGLSVPAGPFRTTAKTQAGGGFEDMQDKL